MEALTESALLKYPPNALYNIRKMFDLEKPGRMKEAIDILEEWIKKQRHFESKNFDRSYLEILIISCKGSLEKAKMKIDKQCTLRTLAPEFFECELIQLKLNRVVCLYSCMPMLTPNFDKIFVLKIITSDLKPEDYINVSKDWIISHEFLQRQAYYAGFVCVYDIRDVNVENIIKVFNISIYRKLMSIIQEGYGIRVKGVHILSNSKLIDTLVAIFKPILPAKIVERLYVHLTLETLHKMVPRELLCKDLGGDEPSLAELHAIIVQNASTKEHIEYMKEVLKQKTDESKRIGGPINQDFLSGTFRNLNVD